MELGAFSISLAVKDLPASRACYETFGFTDVRELQRRVKAAGITLTSEADEASTGPASFVAIDPDGNPLLVDQHVRRRAH